MQRVCIKIACATILALLFTSNTPALAHTTLVYSTPRNGVVLKQSPKNLVLNFSEVLARIFGMAVNTVQLMDANKKSIVLGKIRVDGSKISVVMAESLPSGRYKIHFRVVADDGHVLSGNVNFTVE